MIVNSNKLIIYNLPQKQNCGKILSKIKTHSLYGTADAYFGYKGEIYA